MPGPLAGYRVIDLTTEMGVLAPRLFAGLGAEVIRIEPPGGDPLRRKPPFAESPSGERVSLWYGQQMMGREVVTLDVTTQSGKRDLLAITDSADFVFESQPIGAMSALGKGDEAARARNPTLIWTSITPFGLTGPRAHWRATDLIGMASGGLLSLCGDRDRPPVRPSVEQGYAQAGVQAAAGALMALHARNRFGVGQLVDVSMQACVSTTHGNARLYATIDGVVSERAGGGRSYGATGLRLIYPTFDGYVAFFRLPDSYPLLASWLIEAGFPVSFDPEAWATVSSAGRDAPSREKLAEVDTDVERFFASRTTDALYAEGQVRGLMIAPVATPADLAVSETAPRARLLGGTRPSATRPPPRRWRASKVLPNAMAYSGVPPTGCVGRGRASAC